MLKNCSNGGINLIYINGREIDKAELKLCDYLEENRFNRNRIAIELNGEILPKSEYSEVVLVDGDKVEIVNFVGGG